MFGVKVSDKFLFLFCFQKSSARFSEDGSSANLSLVALEHPSPISVLDTSIYREMEPSPMKTQGSKHNVSLLFLLSINTEDLSLACLFWNWIFSIFHFLTQN